MALHSLHWDPRLRLRRCQDNPIGWALYDASERRVGRLVDLLADDRSREVVYAVAEVEGVPPVLVDMARLTLDGRRHRVTAALSLAGLQLLSPATWWRRPPALQQEWRAPVAAGEAARLVIPVYGERLVTEKRPVIVEEIVITKRQGVRQAQVRETLRRETAAIETIAPTAGPEAPAPRQAA